MRSSVRRRHTPSSPPHFRFILPSNLVFLLRCSVLAIISSQLPQVKSPFNCGGSRCDLSLLPSRRHVLNVLLNKMPAEIFCCRQLDQDWKGNQEAHFSVSFFWCVLCNSNRRPRCVRVWADRTQLSLPLMSSCLLQRRMAGWMDTKAS